MRNQAKKAFSLLLALVMCLSLMSVSAFAAGDNVTTEEGLRTAVANGGSITLGGNIALTQVLDVTQDVVLDLNGYKLTAGDELVFAGCIITVCRGATLTVNDGSTGQTGEIDMSTDRKARQYAAIYGAIQLTKKDEDSGSAANLVINGGTIKGQYYAVSGNGTRHKTDITVNGGKLIAVDGTAIYHPQDGILTLNGGELEGKDTGVEVRSGRLNIPRNSTVIIRSTCTPTEVAANGNGTTTSGAAIAVAQHNTKKNVDVTIAGGKIFGYTALIVSNPENNPQTDFDKVSVSITGGTFHAGNYGIYVKQGTVNVSGGTIDSDNQGIRIEGNRAAGDTETKAAVKSVVNVSGTTSVTADSCGVFITGKGAELNVSGGSISGADYGISGNGRNDTGANFGGTSIEITGGSISSTGKENKDGALYHPQAGKLTISGGTFTGANGIQLCSGEGLIGSIGGMTSVIATGTDGRSSKTDDGYINDGAALSIVNRSYPGGTPKLMVTGGSFTSHAPHAAVLAYTWSLNKIDNKYQESKWSEANQFFTITGGTFSSDPVYYDTNKYEFNGGNVAGDVVEKNTAPYVEVRTSLTNGKVAVTLTDTSTSGISFTGTEANEAKIEGGVLTAPMKDLNAKIVLNNGGYISIADQLRTVALSTDSNVTKEMKNVAKATLNFGEAAAAYFGVANSGYNYSVYGNSFMSELTSAADVKTALAGVQLGNANNQWLIGSEQAGGLKYIGVSLVLKSNTSLRLNFEATNNYPVENYSYSVMVGSTEYNLVPREEGSNYYYAEIATNILPQDLDESYSVTCSGSAFSVTVSPLSYAKIVLEKSAYNENEKLVTLARALYDYYAKASAAATAPAVGN